MEKACHNCATRKTCIPYLDLQTARNAGCNFIGYSSDNRDNCFTPDPAKQAARARANQRRKDREDAYKACGLVKVKGSLGGTYWE